MLHRTQKLVDLINPELLRLRARANRASDCIQKIGDRLVELGELRVVGFKLEVNPQRADRARTKNPKEAKLVAKLDKNVEQGAENFRQNAILVKQSRDETIRAADAVLANLEMLNVSMAALKFRLANVHKSLNQFATSRHQEQSYMSPDQSRSTGGRLPEPRPNKEKRMPPSLTKKNKNTKREKRSVGQLQDALRRTTDQAEKRNLRAALRNAGHTGGLGEGRGRKPGKSNKKKKSKRG